MGVPLGPTNGWHGYAHEWVNLVMVHLGVLFQFGGISQEWRPSFLANTNSFLWDAGMPKPGSFSGQPRNGAATTTMGVFVPRLQVLLDEERNLHTQSLQARLKPFRHWL